MTGPGIVWIRVDNLPMKEQMMENLEKSAQKNGLSSKSPQAQMMLIMQGRRLHLKESTIYVLLLLAILAHILQ